MAPTKKCKKLNKSRKESRKSKLRNFRYDYDYIDFLDTNHKENHSVMQSKFPSENEHYELRHFFDEFFSDESPSDFNFEGFNGKENDFEGFTENYDLFYNYENTSLIRYRAEFLNYVENFKQGVDFDLHCENEKNNVVENNMNNEDGIHLSPLNILQKPLEDHHEDKAVEDPNLSYFVIEKGSKRGGDLITDSWGFHYSYWRKTGRPGKYCKYFRCPKRNGNKTDCGCLLKIRNFNYNEEPMNIIKNKVHNHPPNFSINVKREINMELKRYCMEKLCDNPCQIISQVMAANPDFKKKLFEAGSSLPTIKSMKQTIFRHRALHAPPKVRDINFDLDHRFLPNIPNFYRGQVFTTQGRHMIFFSDQQLEYLKITTSWYVDGTFKIMRDPFLQLLTIHTIVFFNQQTTSIPIAFIYMSRRRKIDYLEVFREIIEIVKRNSGEKPKVRKIMADFEIALWQAIRKLKSEGDLPDVRMKGCFFHFCQAVFRKVMTFNLKKDYFNPKDSGTRIYIKWLMSLPLLPAAKIPETFFELEENIYDRNCTNLKHLMGYFKKNWIYGKNWSVEDICAYREKIRTNNDAESFHNTLNFKIQKTNVDFYRLLLHLGEEAIWVENQVHCLILGKSKSQKTKEQKIFEDLLQKNWEKIGNNEIDAIQFLHNMNHMKEGHDLISQEWSLNFSRIDLEPEEEDQEEEDEEEEEEDEEYEAELSDSLSS